MNFNYKAFSKITSNETLPTIRGANDLHKHTEEIWYKLQEHCMLFCLDAHCRLIHKEILFIGTLDKVLINAREIFRCALLKGAAGIAMAHNHPSGCVEPSELDIKNTQDLARCGRLMDIPLFDHVIVSPTDFQSIKELVEEKL